MVVHIAARAHPVQGSVAARADVVEVVPKGHVLGVALRRRFDAAVIAQGALAVAFAHLVDQALGRRSDAVQVAWVGHQGCVRAGATGRCAQRVQQWGGGAGQQDQGSR